ncbi:MAG: HAMP domain-containing histidine kinase [Brasilonema angustatum HA4187-MV1]|jgi:signal transduction histidine kinase|nr:HAMP domain-containing histidine kinase [Brasilonema angustatum HA4187-MV1]
MNISFSPKKQKSNCHDLHAFDTETFIGLQAEQLTFHEPICFVRIFYYNPSLKAFKERIEYADNQPSFSQQEIAYLRSEAWLTDFPHVWNVHEFQLALFPKYFSYICPIRYTNQKPEYVQIITHTPLAEKSRYYVTNAAQMLSKHIDVCSDNLQQKSKTEILEQVLHKVGHQLRNNIALVKLYAHNLFLGLKDNSWREQATIICESVNDLDTNLTDIISCGQQSNLKIIPQDLRSIVDESIKYLQPLINQKQLKVNIPDTSATLPLDKLQMKQVFDNLLSNAIHFSPNSGIITFSWQVFYDEVLIKISDQGLGISLLDMQKIFTPFYSRRPGGTGLGLTIAKKIVLDHCGNLWADSLSAGGAQFCLILPTKKKYD